MLASDLDILFSHHVPRHKSLEGKREIVASTIHFLIARDLISLSELTNQNLFVRIVDAMKDEIGDDNMLEIQCFLQEYQRGVSNWIVGVNSLFEKPIDYMLYKWFGERYNDYSFQETYYLCIAFMAEQCVFWKTTLKKYKLVTD